MREKALLSALSDASAKHEAAREDSERDYADEMKKIEDKENELISRLRELEEEKLKVAAKYGNLDGVSDDDLVEINAGGRIIVAKRGCLLNGPLWEALFSGRWDKKLPLDDSGRVFFDVNPEAVQYIVDAMNENVISSLEEQQTSEVLINFCKSFNALGDHICQQLMILINIMAEDKPLFESNICSPSCPTRNCNSRTIGYWLRCQGLGGAEINLLYRGSRDGFSSDDFHSKCDNKGHTLVIIETETGGLVGGYTDAEWGKGEPFMDYLLATANKSFLFAIGLSELGEHHETWKSDLKPEAKHGIATNKQCGPVFGDIDVGLDFDLSVQGRTAYLTVGLSYEECYNDSGVKQVLRCNCAIKEIEVFQISQEERKNLDIWARTKRYTVPDEPLRIDRFATAVNDTMNEKLRLLHDLEKVVALKEERFVGEERYIETLSMMKGSNEDIISLNVSGTIMTTTRATLRIVEESVLAQQFDDTKWTEQGHNNPRVNEWTQEEVATWVRSIKDVPDEVAKLFSDNEINGSELLALNEFGLKEMGVERVGTICLLMKEIKQLEKSTQDVSTLIEHSPYCFGKILDFLRLMRFHSLNLIRQEPYGMKVRKTEKKRFTKIVNYYFPGDCAEMVLGPYPDPPCMKSEEEDEESVFHQRRGG